METTTTLDKLNDLYSKYHAKTEGSFHDALWQLMVNKVRPIPNQSAFVFIHGVPVDNNGRATRPNMGLADWNVSGYNPLMFSLKGNLPEKERWELVDELNREVFGITAKRAMEIQLSSMRKQNVEDDQASRFLNSMQEKRN